VLEGKSADDTLLPFIFEAPGSLPWDSREAAAAANPSLGHVLDFDQLAPALARAREDDAAESDYRRLYLSQWTQDKAEKWLDLAEWDACTATPEIPADAALYVGVDLSQGDDLCAVLYIWTSPAGMAIQSHFWVPKQTAEKYEKFAAVPYSKWAAAGAITLLDETTINNAVKLRIAAFILETHKTRKVKALAYDRYKADEAIAALEAAGITCVPVPQGYSLTPGCNELARRLKEGPRSIVIEPNPVLRAAAETVEVQSDSRGNYWPVKPGRKGKYAGKRSAKIDGISAMVTALTEARKHNFPAVKKQWSGGAYLV
jgi:phage terminase large subunit-like protein